MPRPVALRLAALRVGLCALRRLGVRAEQLVDTIGEAVAKVALRGTEPLGEHVADLELHLVEELSRRHLRLLTARRDALLALLEEMPAAESETQSRGSPAS